MLTDPPSPRRLALVLARYRASPAAPPGIDPHAFAAAALADTYEVLADLVGVKAGIVGPEATSELLWPGDLRWTDAPLEALTGRAAADFDELVLVPADVPDLPGLVLAKLFKVLHRVDAAVAPERGGAGASAVGFRLPLADWVPEIDLDEDPYGRLLQAAPRRDCCVTGPDWHRLRTPTSVHRLDPGLEGWEETRALLSGHREGR